MGQVNGLVELVTIPMAFSPNGDGLNDTFFPKFNTPTFYTMEIFNTWGERIFASTGAENHGWDGFFRGQISSASNYFYQLTYTTLEGEVIFRSGGVTLIR
jgi:gliding motility-associated-like protein